MALSPFEKGSVIYVYPFHHDQWLPVEIVSPVSVDYGATSRIYRGTARLPHHSFDVALKVIPHVLSEEREELIRRELKAISRISDRTMRRILPFIGTASVQFHTIIVAEFMENGNLLQYFFENPEADRQRLLIQVAEAVHWLHSCRNLVHGDLKCENVLVNKDGDAALADFGLATLVEQELSSVTTISAIRRMNTLPFAAPELLFPPEETYDSYGSRLRSKTCQSDVYAYGMLSLQAFTEMRPWPGLSDLEIYGKLLAGTLHPRPQEDAAMMGLSNSWWEVCTMCWESVPTRRPTMEWVWGTLQSQKRQPRTPLFQISGLWCISLSPCGRHIFSGHRNGTVWIWDEVSGQVVCGSTLGHSSAVEWVAASPDGRQIASSSSDKTIYRWDAASCALVGDRMRTYQSRGYATRLAYSPDSTLIVSSVSDGTIQLWDAAAGQLLWIQDEAGGFVTSSSLAFCPNGACVASGRTDGTISFYDSASGVHLAILDSHESGETSLCFSPDGIQLVSSSRDGTVRISNMETQRSEQIWRMGAQREIRSIAISPSGRHIAWGSGDGCVYIYNLQTGKAVGVTDDGRRAILSVAFTPDGRSVVSNSDDGTVRVWDLFA